MQKNWLDDEFVLTRRGQEYRKKLETGDRRDTAVCSWYLNCPGTAGCRRICGVVGACRPGCPGKAYKLDRHNCTLMVKMQIFLSDVDTWVVTFNGRHNDEENNVTLLRPGGKGDAVIVAAKRAFGDEEKRILNSCILREKIFCRDELLRRLESHFRNDDVEMSVARKQKLVGFIDRYLAKHAKSKCTSF